MPLPPLCSPSPELSREQVQRYSRHLLLAQLGVLGQRRLRNARVLVVGAGGLGAPILQYLAGAGVGHLGIVDDDVVEASNLQRQVIHTAADVGRPKVISAAEHVAALNDEVDVATHHLRLGEDNTTEVIKGYDLVCDGTDNFATRYLVNDACAATGIPLVWGSILRFDAQLAVFWSHPPSEARTPAGTPYEPVTLRDLFPLPPAPLTTPSCGQAGVLGAMCGQVGSAMAAEAIKLITGTGEVLLGRLAVLDVLNARWHEVPLHQAAATTAGSAASTPPPSTPASSEDDAAVTALRPSSDDDPAATAPPPSIEAAELARQLAARDRGEITFTLLDVREDTERSIATIPGSQPIVLTHVLRDPLAALQAIGIPATTPLVVHCRSGERSAHAQHALLAAGCQTTDLRGGLLAWARDVDAAMPTY